MNSESDTSPRRRFVFRLRTLLIAVVVLAFLVAPVARRLQRANAQRKIVAWVLEKGGDVEYDWELKERASPRGPGWIRTWLGDEAFQSVRSVDFGNSYAAFTENPVDVRDLSPLASLTNLESVQLIETEFPDLASLSRIPTLRRVDLCRVRLGRATALKGLSQIRELNLDSAKLNDLTPLASLTNVRRLSLANMEVADLSPLRELRNS